MKKPLLGTLLVGVLVLPACSTDEDGLAVGGGDTPGSGASAAPLPKYEPTGTVLDAAFGTAGVLTTALAGDAKDRFGALVLGADGKLYAAGLTSDGADQKIAVARFDTDGKKDTSFGSDGVASLNVSPNANPDATAQLEQARSLVVQSDGKVVAVGTAEHDGKAAGDAAKDADIVAVRFDSGGKPDTSFGEGGVARLDLGTGHAIDEATYAGADQGYGSAALPDGGLAILGTTTAGADRKDNDLALLALTSGGELDKDFATDGVLTVDQTEGADSARHVQVVGDQIVATGYTRGADEVVQPLMMRTSLGGELDKTFGTDGVAKHAVLGSVAESYQFGVQGDKYVLTGYGKDTADGKVDLIAYRFHADGALDKSFGTDGVTLIDNVGQDDRGRNLAVLADGRILYVGSGKIDEINQQAMVVVLSKDGLRESAFGDEGVILTDLGTPGDSWYGVALSEDGKTAYLAGFTNRASDSTSGDDAVLGRLKLG